MQLDPTHTRAYVELGEVLTEQNQLDGAAHRFEQALALEPSYSRAWFGLAQSRDRAGQGKEALKAYRAFLERWPHADARRSRAKARVRELDQ